MNPNQETIIRELANKVRSYVTEVAGELRAALEQRTGELEQRIKEIPAGPAGEQGPEGPEGPQGPAGIAGLQGPEGPEGPMGPAGEKGADGVSPSVYDVADAMLTRKGVVEILRGPPGEPGPEGPMGPAGERGEQGPPGKDADPAEIAELLMADPGVRGMLRGEKGDPGPQGERGAPGEPGEVGPEGPAGKNGLDGAIGPMGPIGEKGDPGIDGRDALEIVPLNGIDEVKRYGRGVYATHAGGLFRAARHTEPLLDTGGDLEQAGWQTIVQGVSSISLDVSEDFRAITLGYILSDGTVRREQKKIPAMLYRGVWKAGSFEPGDVVTWDGSMWVCMAATQAERPGEGSAWKLSVKRGRDGRNGERGPAGERGAPGENGKDATQIGPNGGKW